MIKCFMLFNHYQQYLLFQNNSLKIFFRPVFILDVPLAADTKKETNYSRNAKDCCQRIKEKRNIIFINQRK